LTGRPLQYLLNCKVFVLIFLNGGDRYDVVVNRSCIENYPWATISNMTFDLGLP